MPDADHSGSGPTGVGGGRREERWGPTGMGGGGREEHCAACGAEQPLEPFADLGQIPVLCGVHWAERDEALASPSGRMVLAGCRRCAYVRNVAFEPELMVYDTTMDTNLHHSPAFQKFSAELVAHLTERFGLAAGSRVLDIGCGQGEFLRELCHHAGCSGVGYDAMYAGATGPDPSGAEFHTGYAPRGEALPEYDVFTSRHWFEHLADPYEFLADLREQAHGRPVYGYVEVPDACYDLATAGWEVIYPHVSYFDAYSLCRIFRRAGWRVEATGTYFGGMFRWIEVSANRELASSGAAEPPAGSGAGRRVAASPPLTPGHSGGAGAKAAEVALDQGTALPGLADRDRQLAAIRRFRARHLAERDRWRKTIAELDAAGSRPVLWGAGSRGVQFLAAVDRDRRLSAVVDVNPRKWGRYLPGGGHRVDSPELLRQVQPTAVVITNPAYREEIATSLAELGVQAELLAA